MPPTEIPLMMRTIQSIKRVKKLNSKSTVVTIADTSSFILTLAISRKTNVVNKINDTEIIP